MKASELHGSKHFWNLISFNFVMNIILTLLLQLSSMSSLPRLQSVSYITIQSSRKQKELHENERLQMSRPFLTQAWNYRYLTTYPHVVMKRGEGDVTSTQFCSSCLDSFLRLDASPRVRRDGRTLFYISVRGEHCLATSVLRFGKCSYHEGGTEITR